jgi:hypothetical protein
MVCRLYCWACRRIGPRVNGKRVTFSAWAWHRAQETGDTFYKDRIDGLFLLLLGSRNHCQAAFQRHQGRHE